MECLLLQDRELEEIHKQMFFQFGKCDLYHFEKNKEIVIVLHGGDIRNKNHILKIFKY